MDFREQQVGVCLAKEWVNRVHLDRKAIKTGRGGLGGQVTVRIGPSTGRKGELGRVLSSTVT